MALAGQAGRTFLPSWRSRFLKQGSRPACPVLRIVSSHTPSFTFPDFLLNKSAGHGKIASWPDRNRPAFPVKIVPREFIIEAWERQCALAEAPTRVLMQRFMTEQPAVGIYLTVCDERLGDEAGRSQLIPLASAAWEAMTRTRGQRIKKVPPKIVEQADEANLRML